MGVSRLQARTAPAVALLWLFAGCVDLKPPWEKVTAKGGAGGLGLGGAGGMVLDGPVASGGSRDSGVGGMVDVGAGAAGGAIGGAGGAVDAPWTGVGGEIDAGLGGAGGLGFGGSIVDVPMVGTGGAVGGIDGGRDVPLAGAGGGPGTGGTARIDGATGAGGTTGTGGASRTGGATGTGGRTGTGGGTGTGGATTLDAGPDGQPDADPLLTGLVVYYRFESANGTVLPDSSGKGNDGTLSIGAPPDGGAAPTGASWEFVTGKVANGLALHKAGLGYVRVPTAVFANATDLTIAVWVNIPAAQSWPRILDVGITPTTYQFGNTSTGTKYLNIVPKTMGSNMLFSITKDGFASEQTLTAAALSVNTWTHLAVVLASGDGGRLYVNGVEANANASLNLRAADLGTIDYAFIGKSRFDADPPLEGIVDAFRVYHRALSAAEVLALYNDTVGS